MNLSNVTSCWGFALLTASDMATFVISCSQSTALPKPTLILHLQVILLDPLSSLSLQIKGTGVATGVISVTESTPGLPQLLLMQSQ